MLRVLDVSVALLQGLSYNSEATRPEETWRVALCMRFGQSVKQTLSP